MKRLSLLFVTLLVAMLALSACSQAPQAGASAKNAVSGPQPKAAAPVVPYESGNNTMKDGNWSQPLGAAASSAITSPQTSGNGVQTQPSAVSSPEAKSAESDSITLKDVTDLSVGEVKWIKDNTSGLWSGAQVTFKEDTDLSNKPWILVVHYKTEKVTEVKKGWVATIWVKESLRPHLNHLVTELKASQGQSSATQPVAKASTNTTTQAAKAVVVTTVMTALQSVGLDQSALRAVDGAPNGLLYDSINKNQPAGFVVEINAEQMQGLATKYNLQCSGGDAKVKSCWFTPNRYMTNDVPAKVTPKSGPNGEPFTVGAITQSYIDGPNGFGTIIGVIDANDHNKVVDSSPNAVAVVVVAFRTVPVASYDWDWVDAVIRDGQKVQTIEAGKSYAVWIQQDNRPFAAAKTATVVDKKDNGPKAWTMQDLLSKIDGDYKLQMEDGKAAGVQGKFKERVCKDSNKAIAAVTKEGGGCIEAGQTGTIWLNPANR